MYVDMGIGMNIHIHTSPSSVQGLTWANALIFFFFPGESSLLFYAV